MKKQRVRRKLDCILLLVFVGLMVSTAVRAQKPDKPPPPAAQSKTESFWDKVLRYTGISHDASNLKGPGDEVVSGQIWLADLGSKTSVKVTAGGGYRSPVFVPGGKEILVLKGSEVVRVGVSGGNLVKRYAIADITKLVGFGVDDPDTVLVLARGAGERPAVGLLSLSSGKVTPMSYDPASSRDLELIEHLQSWERVYGNTRVYTKRQSKETLYGAAEWTDVYLKRGGAEAVDVSECDGVNCGQPSVSADGRSVVFIKSDRN
jgi:hypothetical protein